LTTALYQSRTRDEIVVADATFGRTTYQNAGRTRRNGLEVAWEGRLAGQLRAAVAYGWIEAIYRDDCNTVSCTDPGRPDKHLRAGNQIPGVARNAFHAALKWEPDVGFRAGVDVSYMSGIQVNDGNTEAAPSYMLVGAHVGYVWKTGPWRLGSFAGVDNL